MPKKLALAAVAVVAATGAVAAYAAGGMNMGMGAKHSISIQDFRGYYDVHFVTYLSTDISNKAEAKAMHINYSASIGKVKGLPEIYLVQGRSAAGQLAVAERFTWPLPQADVDPCSLMERILRYEDRRLASGVA